MGTAFHSHSLTGVLRMKAFNFSELKLMTVMKEMSLLKIEQSDILEEA